jgi:hypothetical protein
VITASQPEWIAPFTGLEQAGSAGLSGRPPKWGGGITLMGVGMTARAAVNDIAARPEADR